MQTCVSARFSNCSWYLILSAISSASNKRPANSSSAPSTTGFLVCDGSMERCRMISRFIALAAKAMRRAEVIQMVLLLLQKGQEKNIREDSKI